MKFMESNVRVNMGSGDLYSNTIYAIILTEFITAVFL